MPPPTRRARTSRPSADASRPGRGVRCAFPQAARAFWVAVRVLYPLFRNRPKKRDPADNMVPAGSHIFPACIKQPAWPLTCENATRGHQIGLYGPLSRRGGTRSHRPKNCPKIGTRAAQTAIYGRGRGPISSQAAGGRRAPAFVCEAWPGGRLERPTISRTTTRTTRGRPERPGRRPRGLIRWPWNGNKKRPAPVMVSGVFSFY